MSLASQSQTLLHGHSNEITTAYTDGLAEWESYSVTSPNIEYYVIHDHAQDVISWTMWNADVTVTVVYEEV
jgi:hypothetical protein